MLQTIFRCNHSRAISIEPQTDKKHTAWILLGEACPCDNQNHFVTSPRYSFSPQDGRFFTLVLFLTDVAHDNGGHCSVGVVHLRAKSRAGLERRQQRLALVIGPV